MPVALSINGSGFNIQISIAEWNNGLTVSKLAFENEEIIPAPAYLSLDYLRLLPEGQCWYDTIPHHWLDLVSKFPDHQLRLLSLVARSTKCQQIMNSPYRLTLYLAVNYFPFDDQRIINAVEHGIAALLGCMQLSNTTEALTFIERVDMSALQYVSEIQALLMALFPLRVGE